MLGGDRGGGRSAFAGWQGWRCWQANQAEQAAALYDTLVKAAQGERREGAARRRRHAGRELPAHALRLHGRAGRGALPLRAQRPEERARRSCSGWSSARRRTSCATSRACAWRRCCSTRRNTTRRWRCSRRKHAAALDAQYAALKGDILVAKNQPAEARAAYRLALEKAGAARCRVPRQRAAAARRARRVTCAAAPLRAARRALLGAVPPAPAAEHAEPESAGLVRRSRPAQAGRTAGADQRAAREGAVVGQRRRRRRASSSRPALVGDASTRRRATAAVARLDAATGQPKWRVSVGKRISGGVGSDGALVAWSPPRRAKSSPSTRKRQGALARARVERSAGAAQGGATAWCWCAAPTAASLRSAPRTASAAGSTSAPPPR